MLKMTSREQDDEPQLRKIQGLLIVASDDSHTRRPGDPTRFDHNLMARERAEQLKSCLIAYLERSTSPDLMAKNHQLVFTN